MHEMSIALGVVDIAEKAFRESGASRIESITLQIGALAGVQLESLYFVWPSAVAGTALEGADRIIESTDGQAVCLECEQPFALKHHFDACPHCNSYFKKITAGKELNVKSLAFIVDEAPQPAPSNY